MASHDGSIGLLAGGVPRRRHGRQLHVLVPHARARARASGPRMGLPAVAGDDFDDSLDAVWERISVNEEHSVPSPRDESIRRGLDRLGWDSQVMKRNVRGCTRRGLPAVPLRLPARREAVDAQDLAAGRPRRRHAHARAHSRRPRDRRERRCARASRRARPTGHRVTVRARAVVSAAGALNTPALLLRSGAALEGARQAPAAAPGDGGLGPDGRGGAALGGHAVSRPSPTSTRTWTATATASSTSTWPPRRASC